MAQMTSEVSKLLQQALLLSVEEQGRWRTPRFSTSVARWVKEYKRPGKPRSGSESQNWNPARHKPLLGRKCAGAIWRSCLMPTSLAKFHDEPPPNMMRHSTGTWRAAPMRTQVRRRSGSGACRDQASYPALGGCPVPASQVLAQTISFYSDLPRTDFSGHSDRGGCSHQPEPRIPEAATVAPHQFWGLCSRRT
jgi:hypothetical protein